MTTRLVITLHLDAFNMAQGGGFSAWDADGNRYCSVVYPGFPGGEMTMEAAAALLATTWGKMFGSQATLEDS